MESKSNIVIDGFLTEQKLANCLRQLYGKESVTTSVRVCKERKFRWDIKVSTNGRDFFVEFDGDSHYRDPMVIKRDLEKEQIAKNNGHKVIRIPYWIQLTNEMFSFYFDENVAIEQFFPHGFVDEKAFLPSSFCELGINRFKREFDEIPLSVRMQVVKSLKEKIEKHGELYVLPACLRYVLCL